MASTVGSFFSSAAEPGLDVRTHFRYIGGGVGLVDSAREENKARAVVEIYLNRG